MKDVLQQNVVNFMAAVNECRK